MPEPEVPDLQILSYLGIHALTGKNAALGARLSFRYRKKKDFFLGPEILVAPLGQSSAVYTLMTVEQSVALAQDGRITGGVTGWGGVAFPQNVPGASAAEVAIGLEFFVTRRIDELARMRLLVRSGIVAGRIMAMGALGVAFRL